METKQLVFFLVLSILLHITLGCPAGYFHTSNVEKPCEACPSGSYCPGDDLIHPCPAGTISPDQGRTSCTACPSKRSDSGHYYCVLPDAPSDAQEAVDNVFNVDVNSPHWFLALSFLPGYGYPYTLAQFTLLDKDSRESSNLVVYVSTKTGRPDESNYEYKASGFNATFVVPRVGNIDYVPMYFTIASADKKRAVVIGKQYSYLDIKNDYHIVQEVTQINTTVQLAWWQEAAVRFIIDKVPAGAKVNFTVSVGQKDSRFPLDIKFSLFHSTLKAIEYPNVYNADVAVNSPTSKSPIVTLVATATADGPFYVTLSTKTLWDARITIHTSLSSPRKLLKF